MTTTLTPRAALGRFRRRRSAGLTLFGVLMALGLAAAAVVGAVTLYNTTTEVQARNEAQALITTLVVATQNIHQGASSYSGSNGSPADLVQLLNARGAIPASAKAGSGNNVRIRHPFGARLLVQGVGDRFQVTLNNLQQANCTQILDPYIGQARASGGLWQVKTGSSSSDLPLTPATVSGICADANDNDLVLVFE